MSKKAFLGIDGGGTKTAFLLDVDGKTFESKQKTIHPMQVREEEFIERLEAGVYDLISQAGIKVTDISHTFAAIPGFGQYPETEEMVFKSLEKVLKSKKFDVGNDCINAWAGSLDASEGINLILGTGSIGYGMDKNGNDYICGGWGPYLGDEASGYYIGNKILNIFTKISDQRLEKTPIYELVKEKLSLKNDSEIITRVIDMKRDEIASLSSVLQEGLNKNDEHAKLILEDVAKEAALIIDTIIKKLDFTSPVKVSYSGGVYNLGDILLDKIKSNLSNEVQMLKPMYSPVEGSVILAKKYYKNE